MVLNDFITLVAEKSCQTKKDTKEFIDAFAETVTDVLCNGDTIRICGLGTFKTVDVPKRECRNPKTGEHITVVACKKPKISFASTLKDTINS